jgi:hypothetical protein
MRIYVEEPLHEPENVDRAGEVPSKSTGTQCATRRMGTSDYWRLLESRLHRIRLGYGFRILGELVVGVASFPA